MIVEDALEEATDMVYHAWSIIANAGFRQGGWAFEDPEWVKAAEHFRDRYHELLPVWVMLGKSG